MRGNLALRQIPTQYTESRAILPSSSCSSCPPTLAQLFASTLSDMQLTSNLRIRRQFSRNNPQARAFTHSRPCPVSGCSRSFTRNSGYTQHLSKSHPEYEEPLSDHNDPFPPAIAEHSAGELEGSSTSGRHRATVEDCEDEDDISSASSVGSKEKTSKYYHSKINGML